MLITLLLTMVALKFTVSDALPNVPYDTPIDVCFNSCFRTLAFIIFISVIPQYFEFIEVDTEVYYVHPMQIANIVCAAGTHSLLLTHSLTLTHSYLLTHSQGVQ